RPWAKPSASACSTLATPATWAAAAAAGPALWPATSTCTSPPQASAAVTVLRVAPLRDALSCSAITRAVMDILHRWRTGLAACPANTSNDLGDVLEFFDQLGHVLDHDAGAALGGLGDLEGFEARRHIHAQVLGREGVERLFLGL